MPTEHFPVLILIGRPASGKSEIIDYLQRTPLEARKRNLRIAVMEIIDDFPMLWTWFEEDAILSKGLGQPRLHTDETGCFLYPYLWHLLIERLGLEYQKLVGEDPTYQDHTTTIVEFSRGSEHGGYQEAFPHLPDDLLQRAGVVYVNVSFEESRRKNRRRFNPDRPGSILEHSLPDAKLERLYRYDDWSEFTAAERDYLMVRSVRVPYVVFENEDDVTTDNPDQLAERLKTTLAHLWELHLSR